MKENLNIHIKNEHQVIKRNQYWTTSSGWGDGGGRGMKEMMVTYIS